MKYELITPSDSITFLADSDKTAFICTVILSNGQAGCNRINEDGTQKTIPTILMFKQDADNFAIKYLDMPTHEYISKNTKLIKDCFLSFAYGSIKDRKIYDEAIKLLSDNQTKLNEFKKAHEDKNRSSMTKWVQSAWDYGNNFILKEK